MASHGLVVEELAVHEIAKVAGVFRCQRERAGDEHHGVGCDVGSARFRSNDVPAHDGGFANVEAPPDDEPARDEKDIADRPKPIQPAGAVAGAVGNDRVFITHGKNRKIVDQLKEIVTFGKFVPIVSEEHETTSRPVPEKVMGEMRSCFAGIIHVAGEQLFADTGGKPYHKINENVLIEIGAAMALYGRNFILLVEKGIQLPSNLQGLYECRYEGEKLDGEATMKLLKAFNEFRAPLK